MNRDGAIEISDDDESAWKARLKVLEDSVKNAVDALGGFEDGHYRPGDECLGCLKDLKRLWRVDDRAVAALLWTTRALPNDIVPLLLETAGRGLFEDKRAIACLDLMAAMTWPVDVAEELKELAEAEEEEVEKEDYTHLLRSHLHYKAALLRPGVMEALLGIILPCLAKEPKERTDRDGQIVGLVLYLVRNLAFIKDLPPNAHSSSDHAELAALQSKLVKALSETHVLDLVVTMASNVGTDPLFERWNTLILEIFFLLFRGVKPESLAADQAKESTQTLRRLLAFEDKRKRDVARNASSRHSRFGTTISVTLNPKSAKARAQAQDGQADGAVHEVDVAPESMAEASSQAFVLHRQQALRREAGSMLDMVRSKKNLPFRGIKRVDEVAGARGDNLSIEARTVLQGLAKTFLESCFNPFLSSLLKDIKSERPKVVEKDHLRLLFVAKWFVEFFTCQRNNDKTREWSFGLVADVTSRDWIVWVLRRMRQAVNEKPKLWTELQAGIESLTQLLQLIECMASSNDPTVETVADILQVQLVYNGEVLDLAFDSLKLYKSGTQSLAYLESSVHLAYTLLKRLEKYIAREGGSVVRRKAKKKKRGKKPEEEGGVPEEEEEVREEEEEETTETFLTFEAYEQKFASPEITQTLLAYLSRYKDFPSSENMKRVVNLLHRQAIKAKAEGLFFKVSTLTLFKSILADKSLPKEQPYKDLTNLISFLLRKFFKEVAEDPFLIVEAFYPKNRGKWKALSSWEPPEKASRKRDETVLDTRFPQEVRVKKGYTWTQQLGIAVAALMDDGKLTLIEWTKQILTVVAAQRQRIVEDTDGASSQKPDDDESDDEGDEQNARDLRVASIDAIAKFTDYMIPYVNDEQAEAATKNPHMKLLFRLLSFAILSEDSEELEWFVPQAIVPQELDRSRRLIEDYLKNPIDLEGKKAAQLLHKKPRKRRRRRQVSSDIEEDPEDEEPRRKRKEKKQKESKQYKSAQFVEDSDVDDDELQKFFEKEKELREKMSRLAKESGTTGTMKATGTKKRRKRGEGKGKGSKKPRLDDDGEAGSEHGSEQENNDQHHSESDADSDAGLFNPFGSPKQGPSTARTSPSSDASDNEDDPKPTAKSAAESRMKPRPRPRPRPRPVEPAPAPADEITPDIEPMSLPPSSPPASVSSRSGSRPASPIELSSDDEPVKKPVVTYAGRRKAQPLFLSDEDD